MFKKNCPSCGKEQIYSNQHNLSRAIKSDSICYDCRLLTHNRELNNRTFDKICIDCGQSFSGRYKSIRCETCNDINNTKLRLINFKRTYKRESKNLGISTKDFLEYGKPFLLAHPDILEVCQIKEKINKVVNKYYYNNTNKKTKSI